MAKFLLSTSLLTISLAIFSVVSVNAQDNLCDLELQAVLDKTETAVEGINGRVINVKSEEVIEGALRDDVLVFVGLQPSVEYKIVVAKNGFKQSVRHSKVICSPPPYHVLSGIISMQDGDEDKIFDAKLRLIGAFKIGTVGEGEPLPPEPMTPPPTATSKIIKSGVVNGRATHLARPAFAPSAKAAGASGAVQVEVVIDEDGNVISAEALSGHPLLKGPSVRAAQASKFKPTLLEGVPVKVRGIIVYNFQ